MDLGGTNIKAGLVDEHAAVKNKFSIPTGIEQGPDQVVRNITSAAERAITMAGVDRKDVAGIGIGSPGPMSHRQGLVINPGNLPGMKNVPLRDLVAKATGIPATLENDATRPRSASSGPAPARAPGPGHVPLGTASAAA